MVALCYYLGNGSAVLLGNGMAGFHGGGMSAQVSMVVRCYWGMAW